MRRALPTPGFNKKGQEGFSIPGSAPGALATFLHGNHGEGISGAPVRRSGWPSGAAVTNTPLNLSAIKPVPSSPTLPVHRRSAELLVASSSPQNPADRVTPSETPSFTAGEPRRGLSLATTCPSPEGAHSTLAHSEMVGTSHVAPDNKGGREGPPRLTGSGAQTLWCHGVGEQLGCFRSPHDRGAFRPSTNLILTTWQFHDAAAGAAGG